MFVIKIHLSKITVNKSKDHSYFEEFTLWIMIKHIDIQSRITPLCNFYFDFVIKIQQSKITVNKSKDHSNKMDTKLLFLIEFSCVLSKSKVIFDTWIFITNTKGTQRFPSWMNRNLICTAVTCFLKVGTFTYKLHSDMALFKHELTLDLLTVIFDCWIF